MGQITIVNIALKFIFTSRCISFWWKHFLQLRTKTNQLDFLDWSNVHHRGYGQLLLVESVNFCHFKLPPYKNYKAGISNAGLFVFRSDERANGKNCQLYNLLAVTIRPWSTPFRVSFPHWLNTTVFFKKLKLLLFCCHCTPFPPYQMSA